MTRCPVCQRETNHSSMARNRCLHGPALDLAQKINPDWRREDGICTRCMDSILDTIAEVEDMKCEQRPSAIGFRNHYRYTLRKREHGQWHHVNADMQRWRPNQIVDRVGDEAIRQGYDCWLIFDADEVMVAQGILGLMRIKQGEQAKRHRIASPRPMPGVQSGCRTKGLIQTVTPSPRWWTIWRPPVPP